MLTTHVVRRVVDQIIIFMLVVTLMHVNLLVYIWSGAPQLPPPFPPMVHGPVCHPPPPPPRGWGVGPSSPSGVVVGFWVWGLAISF